MGRAGKNVHGFREAHCTKLLLTLERRQQLLGHRGQAVRTV